MASEVSAEGTGDEQIKLDLEGIDPDLLLKALKKAEKTAKERALLIDKVASNTTDTVPARVAWVLNHHPSTRNSDVALQVTYWKTFDHQWVSGSSVALENLYRLTRLTEIARACQDSERIPAISSDRRGAAATWHTRGARAGKAAGGSAWLSNANRLRR